jgi:hypothetical protein
MILEIKWTVQYEGIHVHTFEIVISVSFDCHFDPLMVNSGY